MAKVKYYRRYRYYRCYGCKQRFQLAEEEIKVEGHRYHSQACALKTVYADGRFHMMMITRKEYSACLSGA